MSDGSERPHRYEPSFTLSSRQLGMILFLVALAVLFAGSMVAYWVTRLRSPLWRGAEIPGLPSGLWVSSGLIALTSLCVWGAERAARENRGATLVFRLRLTLALAVAFLGMQALNWRTLLLASVGLSDPTLYTFTFYMLTGLHAAHVLGGLVPLGVTLFHAERQEYSSSRYEGVKLCAQYWHFLGVVWFVLLVSLYVGTS